MIKAAEPEGAGLNNNQIPTSTVRACGFARSNCMCQRMTNHKLSAKKHILMPGIKVLLRLATSLLC